MRTRGLVAQIKWPNDVLLNGRKVAGILVEAVWSGEEVDCVVIGIGMNVLKGAVPSDELLQFPATSLEESLGPEVEREQILQDILAGLIALRPHIGTDSFIASWEKALAFRGEPVQVEDGSGIPVTGKLLGLEPDGSLKIKPERAWRIHNSTIWGCAPASARMTTRDILRDEVNMFDNLRESASSSFYEEEQNDLYKEPVAKAAGERAAVMDVSSA